MTRFTGGLGQKNLVIRCRFLTKKSLFDVSDTFMPASFFLSQSASKKKSQDSKDKDKKHFETDKGTGSPFNAKTKFQNTIHMSNRELPSVPDTKQDSKRRESLEPMKISNNNLIGLNHLFQLDCVMVKNFEEIKNYDQNELIKLILIIKIVITT